jgi:hypothetical protein
VLKLIKNCNFENLQILKPIMKKIFFLISISLNLFAQSNDEKIAKIKAIIPELDVKFHDFQTKSHLSSISYAVVVDGKAIVALSITKPIKRLIINLFIVSLRCRRALLRWQFCNFVMLEN